MSWLAKTIGYLGLEPMFGASRQDASNFRHNQVSLADYQDSGASSASGVMGLATSWACVRLVSGTISSLPLVVYKRTSTGREPAYSHPLYRILHDSPNADQTSLNFWQFVSGSVELQGNAYAEIDRAGDGRVIALKVPFAPDHIKPRRNRLGAIEYEVHGTDRRVIPSDRMLHVRGFGGNPMGGLSTLAYGRQVFGMARALETAAASTFRNGIRPAGAFETEAGMTSDQRIEFQEKLTQDHRGALNTGNPLLLSNGLKWTALSINPDDAQMLESRAFSVEEVCRMFGVPPHMIGHTEKSTSWGTGLEQQTIGFVQFTLRERLKNIESSLEKQLLSPAERDSGMRIEFNIEGLLRGDSKSRAEFYKAALGDTQRPGWMVRNEIRRLENMVPVEGWDDPTPLNAKAPDTPSGGGEVVE